MSISALCSGIYFPKLGETADDRPMRIASSRCFIRASLLSSQRAQQIFDCFSCSALNAFFGERADVGANDDPVMF